jgi:Flp pilus assembly protein TadD
MSIRRAFGVFLCLVTLIHAAGDALVDDALAALQRGDFAAAEQKLRVALRAHPNDGPVLSLLAVSLDGQHRAKEAEAAHRRALAYAPDSPDALNNYANHLLGVGDDEGARKTYLKLAATDLSHRNANVQLTRLAIKRKSGLEALGYLKHLPDGEADNSNLAPLRLAALYLAGRKNEADALAAHLSAAGKGDLGVSLSTGMALADAGQFDKAQSFLNQALALAPSDFTVLSNLAVVTSHTGDHSRARELLETALRQQPQNVEVIYLLAREDQALRQSEAAVGLLAQAARLAPERADVQKLLALATSDLDALEDSAAAWDRYRKLVPGDDAARRERGLIAVRMGQFERGLADLRWFVARHPEDAVGHYELGAAESKDDPAQGLAEMDKALALKPDFAPALAVRGGLYYQVGRPEAALTDLETVAGLQPDDAVNLDRLGQTYLALDRPAEAVKVLRKAAELAPGDSKTQLHFARALADAGQTGESKLAMDRFRQLGPAVNKAVPGGLVDFLSLTPEQRHADYRARVEKLVREHPEDAAAQVSYVKLLLDEGKPDQAAAAARHVAALKPSAALLADAGRALLDAKQYAPAKQLLELAAAAHGDDVILDLAVAALHAAGAGDGLQQLDRVPEARRTGDYYLAQAQMLDASGRSNEASIALEAALRSVPKRVDLYRQTAALFIERGKGADALRLLDHAQRTLSGDREVLLMRAAVVELAGHADEAERLLNTLQDRWPEWPAVWAAHGIALAAHGHFDAARRTLETAVALGARSPEVRSCLAESARRDSSSAGEDLNYLRRLFAERPPRDW